MAIPSGLSGQVGVKAESVYGTPVTVDRFYEFNGAPFDVDVGKVYSQGIGTGRFQRSDRVKTFIRGASGTLTLDVLNKGFGLLFEHMIGQNTVSGATANKTHTIVPDANGLQGKMLTVQLGVPSTVGTVHPFTYEGGKVTSWELGCNTDEALKLTLNMDFQTVLDTTALATATYPTLMEQFIFTEGVITIGAVSQFVKSFTLTGNNALATDRRYLGNTKREPLPNGFTDITGTLETEFESLARYDAWVAGTQAALVLTFTNTTVIPTTAVPFSLTITIPKIEYTGETPSVEGPDIVMNRSPFKALFDGTNPIITLLYVTSDTAS